MKRKPYITSILILFLLTIGGGSLCFFRQSQQPATISVTPQNTQVIASASPVSTATSSPQPLPIYLVSGGSGMIKVWEFIPEQAKWSKKYELTTMPDNAVIPPTEVEQTLQLLEVSSITNTIKQLPRKAYITSYSLSPDGRQIAYVTEAGYCFDEVSRCFGVHQLTTLNLAAGQSSIVYQIPILDNSISNLIWSHDSRYLTFEHWRKNDTDRAMVYDLATKTIVKEINDAISLGWLSDNATIILTEGRLQFYPLHSKDYREFLSVIPVLGGLDMNPDGKSFVFSAREGTGQVIDLYLFDLNTESIEKTPIGLGEASLMSPRWSPNGQLIAVKYEKSSGGKYTASLMIIEPKSGQIVNEHPIRNFNNRWWQWGPDSKSIWILGGNTDMGYALLVFNLVDKTSKKMNLPSLRDGEWLGLNLLDGGVWYRQY